MAGQALPPDQLTLPVGLPDSATLDNFFVHPAAAPVVRAVREQLLSQGEPLIYLHGPSGVGKTHLLQAAANFDGQNTLYLPLGQLVDYDPVEVLQGAQNRQRLCLDELQAVAGRPEWDEALFHLFNAARAGGCALLLAANVAPRALGVGLEDLRSRLGWGVVYALPEPDDEAKAAILALRGAARSMTLSPAVASYIVSRAPRGLEQLLAVLDQLAEASLVRKRAVSIPFVKEIMGW
jgi:DnaA family protein